MQGHYSESRQIGSDDLGESRIGNWIVYGKPPSVLLTMSEYLKETPPSAKLVYKVLEYQGPLTQKGIVEESKLAARTVRDALDRLQDRDIVSEEIYIPDARQRNYRISGGICEPDSITA